MISNESIIERIEDECSLPDDWSAYQTQGQAGRKYIEVSGYDGESLQDRIIELIPSDQPEIAVFHKEVPGRIEQRLDIEDSELPSKPDCAGAFIVQDLDSAITALDVLSDIGTLDHLADRRNPRTETNTLDFDEALREAGIDFTTVVTTFESV